MNKTIFAAVATAFIAMTAQAADMTAAVVGQGVTQNMINLRDTTPVAAVNIEVETDCQKVLDNEKKFGMSEGDFIRQWFRGHGMSLPAEYKAKVHAMDDVSVNCRFPTADPCDRPLSAEELRQIEIKKAYVPTDEDEVVPPGC